MPSIEHAGAAIDTALRLTGFDTLDGWAVAPSRTTMEGDNTPFLAGRINGRPAWLVEFDGVRLRLGSAAPGSIDPRQRRFRVSLDAETGQCLGIRSEFDGTDPDLRATTAESAQRQLSGNGERYIGLPDDEPHISLLDALGAVLRFGGGDPLQAKEIIAAYVTHSYPGAVPGEEPPDVWVIDLRGLPPFAVRVPAGFPESSRGSALVPVWQRNHMRSVVNARTGTVIFATNTPQPT